MKLRYLFATLVAALAIFAGCEKEADHYLDEVQVSSSYLAFPAEGGSVPVQVTAIGDWSVKDLPEWLTASTLSGSQGESTVTFTATAAEETREDEFTIECAGKAQTMKAIQVTEASETPVTPIADAIAAGAGNFRVRGTVTKVTSDQYGNFYMEDETGEIYIYGTKDAQGYPKDGNGGWARFGIDPGDIVTVQGPLSLYGSTWELVDVEVIAVEKSLIGVESVELLGVAEGAGVTEFPLEGGSIQINLANKGEGFHVVIPEAAKSWLHIEDFGSDYVVLSADYNAGGDRSVTVSFTTEAGGITYTCEQAFTQKGAILEVSIAEFLAAEVGDTQYRLTGVITEVARADYGNVYLTDWSGTSYVYGIGSKGDFEAAGLSAGDVVTLLGKRGEYKGDPQMTGAQLEKSIITVKDKTLAEIAAASDASDVYYIATGTVKEIVNDSYGNLWLSDNSGDLYVYGCYPGWGATGDNRKGAIGTLGIKVGDVLSVIGVKSTYNDAPQISNGIYFSHEEGTAPAEEWDYTPSDEYLSAANLWKAVDENHTVSWFYNPNWAGELSAPETSFKESTYTIQLNEADDSAEWTSQMWIKPASDFLLDPQKKYTFSCKVHSTTGTDVFIKMYEDGVNWPESFESPATPNRISIAAGETREVVVENFVPLSTPQILLIDFAHHGADNTIHVKDIVVKETGTVTPAGEWDYTPGAAYLADDNLWKANAAGNEMYYYYHCTGADFNGTDTFSSEVPFLTVKESTYGLEYADATTKQWQNQFFIYPAEGHEIALGEANTYKLQLTLGSNVIAPAFFKIEKYNPQGPKHEGELIWEYGAAKLDPSEPLVLEHEITGVSCDNIILVFDFGGNSADTKVYIKDITLVKTAGEEPAQGPSTIAGIIAAIPESATGNNTAVEFEANLTSPAVVSYVNGKNAYIQDETGAILLYLTDHGLTAGDAIKGKLSVKAYWYNGIPEMVAVGSEYEKTSGTAPSPKEITIADLLANYDANLLRLVKLSGVTVTDGIADGDRNGKIVQGGAEIAVYAQLNNVGLTLAEGANGDLVTIPGYYKTNKQVYFWDNAWFTEN